jgi:hypothetical protein
MISGGHEQPLTKVAQPQQQRSNLLFRDAPHLRSHRQVMPLPLEFVPPAGDAWLHEIKHDGFRVVARKHGTQVKLYSRPRQRFDLPLHADRRGACPPALALPASSTARRCAAMTTACRASTASTTAAMTPAPLKRANAFRPTAIRWLP